MAGRRVLLVCQPTEGGAAVVVRELVRAGVGAGFEVTVACPTKGPLAGWAVEAGGTVSPLELVRQPAPSDAAAVASVRTRAKGADVVHLHSSKAGAVGRAAVASLGGDRPGCAFTPHGWSWLSGGRLVPAYRAFERLAAPLADVIIAVSEEERAEGAAVLGSAAGRIRVIENGVDLARFTPDGPRAPRPEGPLLVCAGRLAEAKGQDLAIQALARLRTPGVRLRLVGDGPERHGLERLATNLGVAGRVDFAGPAADIAPELRAADVVVVPSRWDAMSLVLLEAMACGAAIAATPVPGSAALGDAGVIVDAVSPEPLAAAVDALLADCDRRCALGRAARERAVARFDLGRSTGRTVALWNELSDRGRQIRSRKARGRR